MKKMMMKETIDDQARQALREILDDELSVLGHSEAVFDAGYLPASSELERIDYQSRRLRKLYRFAYPNDGERRACEHIKRIRALFKKCMRRHAKWTEQDHDLAEVEVAGNA